MHPLYSINDEPPCTPLPIVKRIFLGSRTGQGFEKKRRGLHLHPLDGDFAPLLKLHIWCEVHPFDKVEFYSTIWVQKLLWFSSFLKKHHMES